MLPTGLVSRSRCPRCQSGSVDGGRTSQQIAGAPMPAFSPRSAATLHRSVWTADDVRFAVALQHCRGRGLCCASRGRLPRVLGLKSLVRALHRTRQRCRGSLAGRDPWHRIHRGSHNFFNPSLAASIHRVPHSFRAVRRFAKAMTLTGSTSRWLDMAFDLGRRRRLDGPRATPAVRAVRSRRSWHRAARPGDQGGARLKPVTRFLLPASCFLLAAGSRELRLGAARIPLSVPRSS